MRRATVVDNWLDKKCEAVLAFSCELLERRQMDKAYTEHAKVTALCVEFALDIVKRDVEEELELSTGAAADALRRVLQKLSDKRKTVEEIVAEADAKAA